MSDAVWTPDARTIERANVTRFMRRHGFEDYGALVARSHEDPEWFWSAAVEDMGLDFATPWSQVVDYRGPEPLRFLDRDAVQVVVALDAEPAGEARQVRALHLFGARAPDELGHGPKRSPGTVL